jgi:transcription elongation factor Elf1
MNKKLTKEQIITRLDELQVEYKDFDYIDLQKTKITYKCKLCGKWTETNAHSLLMHNQTCFDCGHKISSQKQVPSQQIREQKLKDLGIDFLPFVYENQRTRVDFKCIRCGQLKNAEYNNICKGKSLMCVECGKKSQTRNPKDLENRLETLGIQYEQKEEYGNTKSYVKIYCNNCNTLVEKRISSFFNNKEDYSILCNRCMKKTSQQENDLKDFIISLGFTIEENVKYDCGEIDMIIPELNIAFEYNGLFYHNEYHREKDYHYNKSKFCETNGIRLIHIWEDDWLYKHDIVKSMIKNILGKTENKIFARKCKINMVEPKEKNIFLEENHIQGSVNTTMNIGLFYEDALVSLMCFGFGRNNDFQLTRYCSKCNYNITGGFSKLLKYFIEHHETDVKEVKTFADYSLGNGDLYLKNGFTLVRQIKPDYYYIMNGKRIRKQNFTHKKLVEEGYDPNKTEREIMVERKISRIYDCGKLVFSYKLPCD